MERNIEFLESCSGGGWSRQRRRGRSLSSQSCFFPGLPGKESRKIEVRLGRGSILSRTKTSSSMARVYMCRFTWQETGAERVLPGIRRRERERNSSLSRFALQPCDWTRAKSGGFFLMSERGFCADTPGGEWIRRDKFRISNVGAHTHVKCKLDGMRAVAAGVSWDLFSQSYIIFHLSRHLKSIKKHRSVCALWGYYTRI